MKRFLSWTFVVLGLCAGFASCSDDDDEVIPELIVSTPTLAVSGTGGAFEVPILTSGLALDETVEITADVDWVTNLQATSTNFSFEVSKTPLDVESRTATFTLSLSKHAAIKATCTLTQGKNQESFYIQMDELDGTCAIYTVTPATSQSNGKFISYCFSSEELAKYSSATAVKDAIWAKQEAKSAEFEEKYGKFISSTLTWRSRQGCESTQELVRDLEPGKEYTIVAFGYKGPEYETAQEMKVTTDLVKYTFVTPDEVPEVTTTTLDIKVNVHGVLYDLDITTASSEAYINYYCAEKSSFEKKNPTDEAFIIGRLFYFYSGASYQDVLSDLDKNHIQGTFNNLNKNTEGIACAVAFDSHLNAICKPTRTTFTVGEPIPSDNVLTFTPIEQKARGAKIKATGSYSDPFRMMAMSKGAYDGIISEGNTEEEQDKLLAEYIQEHGYIGKKELTITLGLWPEKDYVVVAVGVAGVYGEEEATTKVFKYFFTTPKATISTATCAFDIVKSFDSEEFADVFNWYGAEGYRTTAFTFTQSDDAVQIFYDYHSLSSFQERQNNYEQEGIGDRFLDWEYMNLETGSEYDKMGAIISKEGKDLMIIAAAKDKDGNFGPIAHFIMECDKMPISPISDISVFNPNDGADTKSIQLPQPTNETDMKQRGAQPARTETHETLGIKVIQIQ